jgi:hypothetical protein
MPEYTIGEKIPGTYCPLCGEIGLVAMEHGGAIWAICPMIDGEPKVKAVKDAHTGYIVQTKAPAKATKAEAEKSSKNQKPSPEGDSTTDEENE